ncbi:MAG: siderophore ABC transporter substrate-binding protein [Cellulosilyticaceae bacterium]
MKKYKKLLGALAVCSLAVMGVGCSTASNAEGIVIETKQAVQEETMNIKHQYGEVTVPKNPSSVAVFDFGVLDTLQRLGVEAVTGVVQDTTSRPEYLEAYGAQTYTNIGGLKEPNFEALYELAPEIIFISGRQTAHYDELSKIAPVIFMEADPADYMGSLAYNVNTLAEIFEKEEEAQSLLDGITRDVNQIVEEVEAKELNALIAMVSKGEVSVFSANSRFGIIHNALGFKAADENIEEAKHGQVVTFEYLAKVDPDYLFVVDKNALEESSETAKDTLANPLVDKMKAAQNDQIVYLNPIAWYISPGGVTASEMMIGDVREAISK